MNHRSQSERLMEAFAKVLQHWETRHKAEARSEGGPGRSSRAFAIALSRESGARGTSTAQEVGARLGWTVYDHELLERIAQEMNLRTSLLESVDELVAGVRGGVRVGILGERKCLRPASDPDAALVGRTRRMSDRRPWRGTGPAGGNNAPCAPGGSP